MNKLILTILSISVLLFGCGTSTEKQGVSELDTISFSRLTKVACDYLKQQQDSVKKKYKLSFYESWYYDQETGELTFSDSTIKKVIIDYEEVGSVSLVSNTWLWSWGNSYILPKVKSEIPVVKEYGEKRKFDKLTNRKWTADQYDGWEMASIAAYLMKAKGAYRIPSDNDSLFSFVIFKNIRWADTTKTK